MNATLQSKTFWWGLICILVIYSTYYLLQADNGFAKQYLPYKLKITVKVLVVMLVYLGGSYFLRNLSQKWLLSLWHVIHLFLISILVLLWGWHYVITPLPLNLRRLGFGIHEFLISPLLYLATGLLGKLEDYYQHILPKGHP